MLILVDRNCYLLFILGIMFLMVVLTFAQKLIFNAHTCEEKLNIYIHNCAHKMILMLKKMMFNYECKDIMNLRTEAFHLVLSTYI